MKARSKTLADKSLASMLSAIEIYNKPDFKYREESFSILAINAWELLLKARVLQLNNNKVASILKYKKRKNQDGSLSTKEYRVKNRSGNYNTVSLFKAYDIIVSDFGDSINGIVRENIEALVEIRDNSIHFINNDFLLAKKIHEIGTATIKNFTKLGNTWFGIDFLKYEIYLMPIGFIRNINFANAISSTREERELIKYVEGIEKKHAKDELNDYNFALTVDIKFNRVKDSNNAIEARVSNNPDAIEIQVTEQDMRDKYPWSYDVLTTRLRKRYADFKANKKYHETRKPLEGDSGLCNTRYLDPDNPKSTAKKFYNPNIIKEFDKRYTVRK